MKKLLCALLLLTLAIAPAHAKHVIPVRDGEVVLPEYVAMGPYCLYVRKHRAYWRNYADTGRPCPCYDYPEAMFALCLYPRKHLKAWRKYGYCECVVVFPRAVRNVCYYPRRHFARWRRGGPCPCVRKYPPKDDAYGPGNWGNW